MKVTALLPMKRHSERVPNKNMCTFAGKPLYHCVAQILQDSDYIQSIVINTDSDVIAEDAVKNFSKVNIIPRPKLIQGDMVPMNHIIAYDLSVVDVDHFVQTHSTNPLLTKETLDRAIKEYFGCLGEFDSLFSVTRFQNRLYWESGEPVNHNPQELLRTQDLPPLFVENSNIYLFSKKSFRHGGDKRIGLRPKLFEMNKIEAVDIDDEADFQIAEVLYLKRAGLVKR